MSNKGIIVFVFILITSTTFSQTGHFDRLDFLMGEWIGKGSGFGNDSSKIVSSFNLIMDGEYLEIENESWFDPTEKNPEGEHHVDKGIIYYDNTKRVLTFNQFNNEGYVNQYVFNDSLSNDSVLVFETVSIVNFVPGGKARWIIEKLSVNKIKTTFDVSFPGRAYTCFGTNILTKKKSIMCDKEPKVTGIGGIFFFSDNPEKAKEWYRENLGINTNEWGASFESRNATNPDEVNYLQWSPFEKGSEYFSPSQKDFMINYRVQNIEKLVDNLKQSGVTIVDSIETYDYGKFIHIMDPEGNKIELWEPIDTGLTEIGGETTK